MIVFIGACLGLLCGSFTNVLIARVPSGEQWRTGSSRCPNCRTDLAWYDNIPVLSWVLLRRRCRHCHEPISARYPVVELTVAIVFALVADVFGTSALAVALVYLAVITVALTAIDLEHRRLPDALTLPAYPVLAVAIAIYAGMENEWWILARALIGAAILGGVYFALWFAYPKGMGFGDVKAAGMLGLALGAVGWSAVAVGAIAGPLIGGVVGVAVVIRSRRARGVAIPYGPWLIAGAWLGILAGNWIGHGYVDLVTGGLS
ncbi:A24 family peptidase [Demequina sp.]|uniref:prepilin peptidase n=1 Tax=Demequina sp. TaxID=2050685 RepID=UPI0025BECE59|nr:A24 family peptidase [Demequina sp.]